VEKKEAYFRSKRIDNSSLVQKVIDTLTQAMIEGELKPGDRIPTEAELVDSLGVGRLSIREAIKVLVYYGVLEIRRPEGTFVRDTLSSEMINPMLYTIILRAHDSYDNIKELRQTMEVGSIKLAMQKCTEADQRELWERYKTFQAAVENEPINAEAVYGADNAFHATLSEIGRNPLFDKINSLVRVLTHDIRRKTVENMVVRGEGQTLLLAHKQICDIVFNKDTSHIDEIVAQGYFYDRID
jgi:DNA-binding FadR family transcriptional regulator